MVTKLFNKKTYVIPFVLTIDDLITKDGAIFQKDYTMSDKNTKS